MLLNLILKQGKSLALGLYDKTAGKLLRKCTFKINNWVSFFFCFLAIHQKIYEAFHIANNDVDRKYILKKTNTLFWVKINGFNF